MGKLTFPEELHIIAKLLQYPETLVDVAKNYNVHQLTLYVFELATVFNKFYEKNQVLVEDMDVRAARLALVFATKVVLVDCLGVLGISAPDRM